MKKKNFLSFMALILTLVMVVAQVSILTACKKGNEGDGEQTSDGEGSNVGSNVEEVGLKYLDTQGKPIVLANYTESFEVFDVPAYHKLDGDAEGSVGFAWTKDELLVAVKFDGGAEKITVAVNNYQIVLSSEDYGDNKEVYLKVAFADAGVVPKDLGQLIGVNVVLESGGKTSTFDGYAKLEDMISVFAANGESIDDFTSSFCGVLGGKNTDNTENRGIENVGGGIRFYDKYNGEGTAEKNTSLKLTEKSVSGLSKLAKPLVLDAYITVDSLPVYPLSYSSNDSAFGLSFGVASGSTSKSLFFAIVNTQDGLAIAAYGKTNSDIYYFEIDKELGEGFHLSALWDSKSNVSFFVDGYKVADCADAGAVRGGFSSNSVYISCLRSNESGSSSADDIDVTIENLGIYKDDSQAAFASVTEKAIFGESSVVNINGSNIYLAPEKLVLAESVTSEKYGFEADMIWASSNPDIIAEDGSVTPPAKAGTIVNLKAYVVDGKNIIDEKTFDFFVKGSEFDGNVSMIKNDADPFTGKGAMRVDTIFTLDMTLNSVVYDMGEVTSINRATIKSVRDSIGLVKKQFISVFYSEDNVTYKYLENFSMLQTGNSIYFYNFDVEARYIKVHVTINDTFDETGRIVNSLQDMFVAEYSEEPLLANGSFDMETSVKVKNDTDEKVYDKIVSYTLNDLGISESDLKADKSDIRFVADGMTLPHYYSGSKFYVRVIELDANEELTVKVLYKNADAESVSDGNETLEVQYGTKRGEDHAGPWETSLVTLPNGDLLSMIVSGGALAYYRSTNGGLSWSSAIKIPVSRTDLIPGGGFIIDNKTGKLFYLGYYYQNKPNYQCTYHIYLSEDNGYTWSYVGSPGNAPQYAISYSNGIALASADGEGPNVDYVYSTGVMRDLTTAAFCTSAFYSKDGGKTWTFSNSMVNYEKGANNFHEGGLSEDTIWEKEDGTLIFYARCQIDGVDHFAMSYSYDHGITWSPITDDTFTNFYTVNTQPIVESLNGMPVFLWGGNTSLGGRSYLRYPLNLAYSEDDGETFIGMANLSFQTTVDKLERLHTNPDLTFHKYGGVDSAYIVSTEHEMYVLNVDDYLLKTKGAFDSFEDGVKPEGWMIAKGLAVVTSIGATDGDKAMYIGNKAHLLRSVPYTEEGSTSFDLFVSDFGEGFSIELQAAYNDDMGHYTAPLRVMSDAEGNLYAYGDKEKTDKIDLGLKLNSGANSIDITFNGNDKEATITVNGKSADLKWYGEDNYVSYITVWTESSVGIAIDNFMLTKKA